AEVKISDIQFTGNAFVGSGVLATHINSSKKILGLFGGQLNREMIDDDVRKLLSYYDQFGFHDARVSYEMQYLPDGRNAVVVFHVIEGDRYRLKNKPIIEGAKAIALDQLEQLSSKQNPNDYYDGQKVIQEQKAIEDWYGYQGIKANVEPIKVWSQDVPGVVEVHYK